MDTFILSATRTPIGKFLGELSDLPAPRLGALVVAEAIKRASATPGQIDEVILGNVVQAGVGQAPARQAALFAGLPDTIAAFTVNKVCGSGLKAVMLAAQAIKAEDTSLLESGPGHATRCLPSPFVEHFYAERRSMRSAGIDIVEEIPLAAPPAPKEEPPTASK